MFVGNVGLSIITPALRKAGIKKLPGTGTSVDQGDEMLLALNRILDAFNIDGFKIFAKKIEQFALTASTLSYTIGPGANFNTVRPVYIESANCIEPTNPSMFLQLRILDSREWASLSIRTLPGSPVYAIYYDGDCDTVNGWGKIYVLGQPPVGWSLELFTWRPIVGGFTSISDGYTHAPAGYLEAFVAAMALECMELYPLEAKMSPETRQSCLRAIQAIRIQNAQIPHQANDTSRFGKKAVVLPAAYWNGAL